MISAMNRFPTAPNHWSRRGLAAGSAPLAEAGPARHGRPRGRRPGRRPSFASRLAAPAAIAATTLVAGCGWFGGDRDEIPDLAPIEALATVETLWTTDAGSGIGRHSLVLAPAVRGGRVYVADARGRVTAWDAASGRSIWRTRTRTDITGGVGAGGGRVLAGTENGEVLALAADTGEIAWRTQLTSEVLSRPQVAGGHVVVRTLDGKLVGLEAQSGEERWTFEGIVPNLTVRGTGSPAVVSGVSIAGLDSGRLVATRGDSGEVLWEASVSDPRGRSELERLADIDTEPVAVDGVVYAASYEREVAAVDVDTGRTLWRVAIPTRTALAADLELVYVADSEGTVHGLDRLSGTSVWAETSLTGRAPAWPVVHGPFVAVTDVEGYVHWLRREDGRPAARTGTGRGALAGPPALEGDVLFVYWAGGRLTAFEVD